MEVCDVVIIVLATIGITGTVMDALYRRSLQRLRSKFHNQRTPGHRPDHK